MHLFSGNLRYVIEEPFLGISESTFFICWNFFPKQMPPFPKLSFWLSSTGAAVLLSPPPSMLILPLYLNLRSKEISPEHISFPYIYSWKKWLENLYFYKEQFHVIVNNRDTFLLYEHTICRAIIFWVLWALHWENHFPHRKWQVCEVSYNGRLWYKFSCFVGTQGQ